MASFRFLCARLTLAAAAAAMVGCPQTENAIPFTPETDAAWDVSAEAEAGVAGKGGSATGGSAGGAGIAGSGGAAGAGAAGEAGASGSGAGGTSGKGGAGGTGAAGNGGTSLGGSGGTSAGGQGGTGGSGGTGGGVNCNTVCLGCVDFQDYDLNPYGLCADCITTACAAETQLISSLCPENYKAGCDASCPKTDNVCYCACLVALPGNCGLAVANMFTCTAAYCSTYCK